MGLEENVTRAAEKLHVSQPALSRQIKDLEEELGFALLERSAKSVALTDAGRVFLDEASEVLERLEQGISAAREAAEGEAGELHVGYAPSLTVRILPPTIRAFQAELPKVKVKLYDMSSEEMLAGLRERKLDFAFMLESKARKAQSLEFRAIREERIRLAVGLSHRWDQKEIVSLGALKKENLIGYSLEEYPEYGDLLRRVFEPARYRPKLSEEHESVSSLIASIEAGLGVSIVSESLGCVAGGRIRLLELDPVPDPLTVGVAWVGRVLDRREESFLSHAESAGLQL
ncbi:LysR family transcriptional regulator [Pelagicoccus albus]|uniref:LysR family transcriptional regulator n=1 Tax=Pelagicoccus albus TaxID=415222 RepID=A0A7X1E886_9BACT|nr:LysR family transcriptional regulator [Pelagicoccus albus]